MYFLLQFAAEASPNTEHSDAWPLHFNIPLHKYDLNI